MGGSYRVGELRGQTEVEGIILAALTPHQVIPGKFCPSVTKSGTMSVPPNDSVYLFSLEQDGRNWIRGIDIFDWDFHVAEGNFRVAGDRQRSENIRGRHERLFPRRRLKLCHVSWQGQSPEYKAES